MTPTNGISTCVPVVLLCFVMCCSACFWRNCPSGGKRGLYEMPPTNSGPPCASCGPRNEGQCFGPDICCTPTSGCLIGSEYSRVCSRENENIIPCVVAGKPCGDQGNCASDGVCCNIDGCKVDSKCKINRDATRMQFLDYLEKLLKERAQ